VSFWNLNLLRTGSLTGGIVWFEETLYPSVHQGFAVARVLYDGCSAHQHIRVLENQVLGRVLVLDGVVQTTEADEFVYHEMLTHVPLFAHGRAKRVLIIGGGDGGILREVLRHDVEKAVMVELDEAVVKVCREHMPKLSAGAFEDPRAELVIGDGARYVAETSERFDVIISDSTDPVGPAEVLFGDTFYGNCRRCLKEGGVFVAQNGVPFFQGAEVTTSRERLSRLFPDVTFYVAAVPTYYGGFMTLAWAALDPALRRPPAGELARRVAASGLRFRYYNADIHEAAFALPSFVQSLAR
jgi:spermidine synthase